MPLMRALMHRLVPGTVQTLGRWLAAMGRTPLGIAALAVALAAVGAQYGNGLVRPGNAFLPPWTEWAHNGLFYVFGLVLRANRQVLLAHYMRR